MKIDKVVSTIEKYRMLEKGDNVTVGFSGGADSVCLLHILCMLRERYQLNIIACHINHMLRAEESDRDEQFCKDFCEKHNIQLQILCVNIPEVATQKKESTELCARKIRYGFFEKCANGKIATAHSLSDSMETMLFNMMRGTALKGLCSIPETRGNIIRPLIECTRQEIEEYCKENGLCFVTDSSNLTDEYARNRIRHRIIPQMQAEGSNLYKSYLTMHKALSRDEDFLNSFAEEILKKSHLNPGFDVSLLSEQHDSIIIRCIAKLFSQHEVNVDTAKLELVHSIIKNGAGSVNLCPNVYATVKNSILTIEKQIRQEYFEYPVTYQEEIEVFSKKSIILSLEKNACSKNVNQNVLKKYIDCDKIGSDIVVRQRKEGDSVRLASNKMTKTLKKLFNERKIPVHLRDKVFVISDREGIVWVEGFGVAQRCAVDENTKNILAVEIKDRTEKQ